MRRYSVRTRLLGVASAAVLAILAVSLGSAFGVVALGSASDRVDELSRAGDLNTRTISTLREIHDLVAVNAGSGTTGGASGSDRARLDDLAERIDQLAPRVAQLLGRNAFEAERAASTADARAVQALKFLLKSKINKH